VGNFNEVEQHCSKTDMTVEAKRCLECGCNVVDICLLKKHSQNYHADQKLFEGARRTFKTDYSHEKIKMETHKCINCNACVRACEEVKKCNILGNAGRGFSTRIAPMMNMPLNKTHCDGCEECVNVCPTAGVRLERERYLLDVHG
jgi:predicted molibdopterin-dependent oxidoreductase YjgC